jgi:pimeloyl-ACP methyl ester carboxylesterase
VEAVRARGLNLAYHPPVSSPHGANRPSAGPAGAGPRFLYLHGFASGPGSTKGRAFEAHFARQGLALERLDLRVPSLEHLRLSAALEVTRAAIGGPRDRAVLFGSSLGGLIAARVAAVDARVSGLVLLAPAFRLAPRWRERMGEAALRRWEQTGWLEIDDHATRTRARVDFGFFQDLDAVEAAAADGGLPDVRVPTLILHGRGDETVPIQGSRVFAAGKRHVRLIELDDGHELTASLPALLAAAETFLAGYLAPVDGVGAP